MHAALLLVDLQADFLNRPGLTPAPHDLSASVARLLNGCRALGVPVLHVHTIVDRDGSNRMPHWKRNGTWACVEGTEGAKPPGVLLPVAEERVFRKQYYSAFGDPALHPALRRTEIDTLIIAGLYLHGCVRSTALDAYERGLEVWIASDAVGSTEGAHADATRNWLDGRAACFLDSDAILERLNTPS